MRRFLAFVVELARLLRAQWLDAKGFNVSEFLSPLVQKVPSVSCLFYLVRFSLLKLGCNAAAGKAHACLSRR